MDFYEMLGVERNAQTDEIKQAYLRLLAMYSREAAEGSQEAVKKISDLKYAKNILTDPQQRSDYDRALESDERMNVTAVDLTKRSSFKVSLEKPVQEEQIQEPVQAVGALYAEPEQPVQPEQRRGDEVSAKKFFVTNAVAFIILSVLIIILTNAVK